ncbi:hypothetical protein X733_24920 [Mesorhizobium sp. L2C067A000]|nr:hypothetical protein X733_24920 [Mesorhizobium sp. L2C067A000]
MQVGFFMPPRNIVALRLFGHTRLVLQRSLPVTKMAPHSSWSARARKQARAIPAQPGVTAGFSSFSVIAVLSVGYRFFECACCCIASDT